MTPVTMPRSREERVAIDGREYRVLVAWPREAAPPSGFPVFFVLDANAAFGTVVEAIRMRSHRPDATGVGPAVVVGVAYPGDGPYNRERRTFDFTPPTDTPPPDGGDGRAAIEVGGAGRFLAFLQDAVTSIAERDLPIDRTQRTIIGHSLAGFFVLHTLVTAPASFETYVAISPSIWWDREALLAGARTLAGTRSAGAPPARVLITAGEYEQTLAPWQAVRPPVATVAERRKDRQMVDHARHLAAELGRLPNVAATFHELPGQDHASVVPLTISEALRFAFGIAPPPG